MIISFCFQLSGHDRYIANRICRSIPMSDSRILAKVYQGKFLVQSLSHVDESVEDKLFEMLLLVDLTIVVPRKQTSLAKFFHPYLMHRP